MRRYLLLLVLAMACTSALWAQKVVTGTITDASTKEALIGASVIVKGSVSLSVSEASSLKPVDLR